MVFDFLKAKIPLGSFSVLDFSGSRVRAVITDASRFRESQSLSVVGLGEELYPEGTVVGSVIGDVRKFKETARLALKKASTDCGFNPKSIVYSLSGEFSKAISVGVRLSRKAETRLNTREWSDYEKKIQENLVSEVNNESSLLTGGLESETEIMEKVLISCRMGGKEVSPPPVNVDFSQIDLGYLISFTEKDTNALLSDVAKSLGKTELYKTARIVNLFYLLTQKGEPLNAIFVDLDSVSTDIALVLDSFLIGVRTLPLRQDTFSTSSCEDWLTAISVALEDFEGIKSFPPIFILCGADSETRQLAQTLDAHPWIRKFPFATAPKTVLLEDLLDASFVADKTGRLREFLPSATAVESFRRYVQN